MTRRCLLLRTVLFRGMLPLLGVCGVLAGEPAEARTIQVPGDATTIQAGIDAAARGDVVLVAAGTYRERVRLKAGVTLQSAGTNEAGKTGLLRAEQTIIDGGGADGEGPGVTMAEEAVLDGFTVTNVGVFDLDQWEHHYLTQGNEQAHEHIGNYGTPGIGIVGVSCIVRHNIVHHVGDTGIGIRGTDDGFCAPRVELNVCYRNMGGGIGVMHGATGIIRGNRCYQNFFAGIGHDGASPLVLENVCYENIRAGIGISEDSCPVVRGNTCHHNRRAGIGIRTGAGTQPVVERNECFENDMAGIGCEEGAEPVIRGNHCHHNRQAGIGTQDHARPLIVDNRCEANEASGIGVRAGADAVLVRNQCIENTTVAVGVVDGSRAVLIENTCRRSGGMPPLVAVRQKSSADLLRNTLTGGGVACVLAEGTVSLYDNTLKAGTAGRGTGVWGWKESRITAAANRWIDFAVSLKTAESQTVVVGNDVSQPGGPAIRLGGPAAPAVVAGNRFAVPGTPEQVVQGTVAGDPAAQNEFSGGPEEGRSEP